MIYQVILILDVQISDIDSNKIRIEWINNSNNIDSCAQILSGNYKINAAYLAFLPKDDYDIEKWITFRFYATDSLNLHYDYFVDSLTNFDYVAVPRHFSSKIKTFVLPTISGFYPEKKFRLLDTVEIIGKNFTNKMNIQLYSKGGYHTYRTVPKKNILSRTDSTIVFRIPELVIGNNCEDRGVPKTGLFRLVKRPGVLTLSNQVLYIE